MNADQEDGSKAVNPTPKDPPAAPDQADGTAGGVGGAAPASLDLYGQSRKRLLLRFLPRIGERKCLACRSPCNSLWVVPSAYFQRA